MTLRISTVCPVLNEAPWIGYSILSCLEQMHEFVYALDEKSSDGTRELLHHIKDKYAHEKLVILETPNFHPHDTRAYNGAFNRCIEKSTGDAVWFYHPDMLVTKWSDLKAGPLAWYTNVTSFAGDFNTVISKGRCDKWKNIHKKTLGLTYLGGYGSQNEDFYHAKITGNSLKHYGTEFSKYPFEVANSGIEVNHYCELKGYKRRLEKMKLCLKTQNPEFDQLRIEEMAAHHPRVTLEQSSNQFGHFEFSPSDKAVPEVVSKYKEEFESFMKQEVLV